jgi:hypothetical protein
VIAVNARGPRLTSPYPTTYFPDVSRELAEVIDLAEGERKSGFTIVVSAIQETTISGMVSSDDGRPIADADVSAAPVEFRGMYMGSAKTDSNGRFELRVLVGMTYRIRAGIRTERGYRSIETVVLVDQLKDGLTLRIAR